MTNWGRQVEGTKLNKWITQNKKTKWQTIQPKQEKTKRKISEEQVKSRLYNKKERWHTAEQQIRAHSSSSYWWINAAWLERKAESLTAGEVLNWSSLVVRLLLGHHAKRVFWVSYGTNPSCVSKQECRWHKPNCCRLSRCFTVEQQLISALRSSGASTHDLFLEFMCSLCCL